MGHFLGAGQSCIQLCEASIKGEITLFFIFKKIYSRNSAIISSFHETLLHWQNRGIPSKFISRCPKSSPHYFQYTKEILPCYILSEMQAEYRMNHSTVLATIF